MIYDDLGNALREAEQASLNGKNPGPVSLWISKPPDGYVGCDGNDVTGIWTARIGSGHHKTISAQDKDPAEALRKVTRKLQESTT